MFKPRGILILLLGTVLSASACGDAAGTVLYQEDLADDSDTTTAAGVAGMWRIEVRLESTTGTFNFRVQKTT